MREYIITTEKGANQQLHELTRCKDCKYAKEIPHVKEWDYSCRYFNTHSVMADDFCSRAVRRKDVE